jgi:hypothetical protein
MRVVKITYLGLVFCCVGLIIGDVSRRLGWPSGGLCRWRTNGWGWRGKGRWTCLRVGVLRRPDGAISFVWVDPPDLAQSSIG